MATGTLTYDFSEFVGRMSFERTIGGLRSQSISSHNGGAPDVVQLKSCGMPGLNRAGTATMSSVLMIVVFSVGVICRRGSVEIHE